MRAEVDAAFDRGTPTAEDLRALDVTNRIVPETMRMYPVVPVVMYIVSNSFDFGGFGFRPMRGSSSPPRSGTACRSVFRTRNVSISNATDGPRRNTGNRAPFRFAAESLQAHIAEAEPDRAALADMLCDSIISALAGALNRVFSVVAAVTTLSLPAAFFFRVPSRRRTEGRSNVHVNRTAGTGTATGNPESELPEPE